MVKPGPMGEVTMAPWGLDSAQRHCGRSPNNVIEVAVEAGAAFGTVLGLTPPTSD